MVCNQGDKRNKKPEMKYLYQSGTAVWRHEDT